MALDTENSKNTLFGGMKKSGTSEVIKSGSSKHKKSDSPKVEKSETTQVANSVESPPKWKTMEKVTVLMTTEQRDVIEDTARRLMRFRSKGELPKEDKERITANTVLRALLSNFIDRISSLELASIQNEEELQDWLKKMFR